MSFESWNKEDPQKLAIAEFERCFPIACKIIISDRNRDGIYSANSLRTVFLDGYLAGILVVRDLIEKHGLEIVEKRENDSTECNKD